MHFLAVLAACTASAPEMDSDVPIDTETSPQETCETVWQTDLDGVALDVASGFVWCWDVDRSQGAARRVADVPRVVDARDVESCAGHGSLDTCASNAECGGELCLGNAFGTGLCMCQDVCMSDADCDTHNICAPTTVTFGPDGSLVASFVNVCTRTGCASAEDCASGECVLSRAFCAFQYEFAACARPVDTCRFDSDCHSDEVCNADSGSFRCRWVPTCD